MFDEGKFIVSGIVCGAVEVVIYAEGASERGSGDGAIIKMDITGDGLGGDTEIGVGPCSIGERGNL